MGKDSIASLKRRRQSFFYVESRSHFLQTASKDDTSRVGAALYVKQSSCL